MYNSKETLQMIRFAIIDTDLFLDAYPNNKEAQMYRDKLLEMYYEEKAKYMKDHGGLTMYDVGYDKYINDPWPWEAK